MLINMKKFSWIYIAGFILLAACKPATSEDTTTTAEVRTPVTVTSVSQQPISEFIELNATSVFLQKSIVKANINGYIGSVNTQIGKHVDAGQIIFSVKTKESETIGNAISNLDSSLHFSGMNNIRAGTGGFITELDHQPGDYVQDGEQLAVISNQNSFVFLLNLPYELRPYLPLNKTLELVLPDGQKLSGTISAMMPAVDSTAQTQFIVIKVISNQAIPENLVARVRFVKREKYNSISLPKAAVLTDESQTYAWVMKMVDSSMAVRVDITKGISSDTMVEILSPRFLPSDKFLISGNYGLPDTALVIVTKQNP